MLTDIFAYRYLNQPIWLQYTEFERRLLNQSFAVVKDLLPYYYSDGKVIEANTIKWKSLHDRLAREFGIQGLSTRYYAYTSKNTLGQFPCLRMVHLGLRLRPVRKCEVLWTG